MAAHIALVIFAMLVLMQLQELVHSPTCGFCGKRREHARDCPQKRDK